MTQPRYVVAIIGGATAGAETASILAESGTVAVVFEQSARPYGKIEDGLPRWHAKLRQKEYLSVNEKLDRPHVHFVPLTRIGRDIDFEELATHWGFTAVILAVGAWRDRPLPLKGADDYVGRGLVYQNAFIYWFNHYEEPGFEGPHYEVHDGAIVVGGGLASIDVMKVLQLETVRRALEDRGIVEDVLELEHAGIGPVLERHGLSWQSLGLKGATLFVRRRVEGMPLVDMPEGADEARRRKVGETRKRILTKAMEKYLFRVQPQRAPAGLMVENERLVGLRFQHTRVENDRVLLVDGAFDEVRAPLVISSIGSIPEPLKGVPSHGELFDYTDPELGQVAGYEHVFGAGNAVTGRGNIVVSRKHGMMVGEHLIEHFLGLGETGHGSEEELLDSITNSVKTSVGKVLDWVGTRPALTPEQVESILARVRARQRAVGYSGSYEDWIARHAPME